MVIALASIVGFFVLNTQQNPTTITSTVSTCTLTNTIVTTSTTTVFGVGPPVTTTVTVGTTCLAYSTTTVTITRSTTTSHSSTSTTTSSTSSSTSTSTSTSTTRTISGSAQHDVPTFVASQSNPFQVYQYTAMQIQQRLITSDYKTYAVFFVNTGQTSTLSAAGARIVTTAGFNTNNIYWNVASGGATSEVDTVGGNTIIGSDGNPQLNQFTTLNPTITGQSTNSEGANTIPGIGCVIDSGGQQRHSIYTLISNGNSLLTVTGDDVLTYGNGTTAVIFFVGGTTGGSISSGTACPTLNINSNQIDWAVTAPPGSPFTLPGNYMAYPSIGATTRVAGTGALTFDQQINPSSQLPN